MVSRVVRAYVFLFVVVVVDMIKFNWQYFFLIIQKIMHHTVIKGITDLMKYSRCYQNTLGKLVTKHLRE